jgi:hypothetical protein
MLRLVALFFTAAGSVSGQLTLPPTPAKGTPLNAIPIMGLGTARLRDNTSEVVASAIVNGFRHIDAAFAYGNQKDVGIGIKEGLKRTGLKRSDLWITSKLYNDRFVLMRAQRSLLEGGADLLKGTVKRISPSTRPWSNSDWTTWIFS